jgi:hypothetical protein
MLKLTTNKGLAIFHLAKKAKKKIPLYEEKNADMVNVPFFDQTLNKIRYLTFLKKDDGDWGYAGVVDEPVPTRFSN